MPNRSACPWGEIGDNVGNAAAIRLQYRVNVVSSHPSMFEGLATRLHCERTANKTPHFLTQNPAVVKAVGTVDLDNVPQTLPIVETRRETTVL